MSAFESYLMRLNTMVAAYKSGKVATDTQGQQFFVSATTDYNMMASPSVSELDAANIDSTEYSKALKLVGDYITSTNYQFPQGYTLYGTVLQAKVKYLVGLMSDLSAIMTNTLKQVSSAAKVTTTTTQSAPQSLPTIPSGGYAKQLYNELNAKLLSNSNYRGYVDNYGIFNYGSSLDEKVQGICDSAGDLRQRYQAANNISWGLYQVLIPKMAVWKSQGLDTSKVESALRGQGGWFDTEAQASPSNDVTAMNRLCPAFTSLMAAIDALGTPTPTPTPAPTPAPTPTPTPAPAPEIKAILSKGLFLKVPAQVIKGSVQPVDVLIFDPNNLNSKVEGTVIISEGDKELKSGPSLNGVLSTIWEVPQNPNSKYTKICATSIITSVDGKEVTGADAPSGGKYCRTISIVPENTDISQLVALENQQASLIRQLLAAGASSGAGLLTLPTLPELPTPADIFAPPAVITPSVPTPTVGYIDVGAIPKPAKSPNLPIMVYIDGRMIGNPPLKFTTTPGKHPVRITLRGFTDITDTYEVRAGETVTISGLSFK